MKALVISFALFLSYNSFTQSTFVKYVLSAEARALMCPFLSPKLIEALEKKGAEQVYKDEELKLHFKTKKENELSDEAILKIIDFVGYDPKYFKIDRIKEK
ncbi:MAG: hypothetical protein ACKO6A_08175 [Bacteroidota bacterium]